MEHTFDKEERDFLRAFEVGEWMSVPNVAAEKARFEEAARNTLALSERLTVCLTRMDLITLKACAAREGSTPQALAGSILHKYITGQLVPREKA
jgi:predicted DNA binding CopG/RHH family protein